MDRAEAVVVAPTEDRFVSRGGQKLEAALASFGVDASGRRCLDAGASTGGFTDCLLKRGAASVVAIDVGYGQLHDRLRRDRRVEVLDRTNVRDIGPERVSGISLVVVDLSFISVVKVLDALFSVSTDDADLLLLVKPQFESTRAEADAGRGVVRDSKVWHRVLMEVGAALKSRGAGMIGAMASPVTGATGNVEFLVHARRGEPEDDLERLVTGAVAAGVALGGSA